MNEWRKIGRALSSLNCSFQISMASSSSTGCANGETCRSSSSTLDEEQAKIDALGSGADDYMTKPFSPGELVARLAARLRAAPTGLIFESDGLVIDLASHRATLGERDVHLTATEFALLRVLATSRGTVSYRTLAKRVWGSQRSDAAPRIRTHIANLRAKLDPGQHRELIETEVGIGYRFTGRAHRTTVSLRRVAAGS